MTPLSGNQALTQTLLSKHESLPDQPRPLCILLKDVGPCSNGHVPLWQTPNNVTYCQQLPTVEAGGDCSDCYRMAEDIRLVNALENNNTDR